MPQSRLREHGWLSYQPKHFQDQVLGSGMALHFTDGKPVFRIGDPPGGIYGVLSGMLAVSIAPRETGPHLVHQSSFGSWFGEGAFLTGQPRRIGLDAIGDVTLFFLPLDQMERLAIDNPENTRRFGQIAMLNIDACFHAMNDLLIRNPRQRVAATLVRCLGNRAGGSVAITQTQLGQIASTSRKVVNQSLKAFARLGFVRPGYASVEIVDVQGMKQLARGDA